MGLNLAKRYHWYCASADVIKDGVAHNATWVDMGEANLRCAEGWTASNITAQGSMSAPVPKRNIGGAASRYSAALKRVNNHEDTTLLYNETYCLKASESSSLRLPSKR